MSDREVWEFVGRLLRPRVPTDRPRISDLRAMIGDGEAEHTLLRQEWASLNGLQRALRLARLELRDADELAELAEILAITAQLRKAESDDVPRDWLDAA